MCTRACVCVCVCMYESVCMCVFMFVYTLVDLCIVYVFELVYENSHMDLIIEIL